MLDTEILSGVRPVSRPTRTIRAEFRDLLANGAALLPAGEARADPERLAAAAYPPRHRIELFDATYWVGDLLVDDDLRFFVAYVAVRGRGGAIRSIHPRVVYKDSSLVWRVATHLVRTGNENWIGKGDLKEADGPDGCGLYSAEETTNLPYELFAALDRISHEGAQRDRTNKAALLVGMSLRRRTRLHEGDVKTGLVALRRCMWRR
jgi:hypothetical protein